MSTLEVLMKAEQSLLDMNIPFEFDSFFDCTCGHILRAVEGRRGYAGYAYIYEHPEYQEVIYEVAVALGYDELEVEGAIYYVSTHTYKQALVRPATRKHALKTIRAAMLALQPVEQKEYVTA